MAEHVSGLAVKASVRVCVLLLLGSEGVSGWFNTRMPNPNHGLFFGSKKELKKSVKESSNQAPR